MAGHGVFACASPVPISRSYTYKKVTKPMLERRRRARISKCLEDLKALMVGPLRVTEESLNRLEKADILELAVQHLQNLRFGNANKYQEGFNECAAEACHFLEKSGDVNNELGEKLVEHLESCIGPLHIQVPQFNLMLGPESPESCVQASSQSNTSSRRPLTPPSGLLMEANRESVLVLNKAQVKYFEPHTPSSIRKRNSYHPYSPSSSGRSCSSWQSSLSSSSSATSLDMWRPW